MRHKLQICEQCSNLISYKRNRNPVFTCPVCGVINERNISKTLKGNLTITSPDVITTILPEDEGSSMFVKDMNEELEFALSILLKYDFIIIFKEK